MLNRSRPLLKAALASAALAAIVPLAACNDAAPQQSAYGLPELPATLPLAIGGERPIAFAPPAPELPRVQRIRAVQVAEPDDYYAYAEDAWSYADALGEAPPDYGFYYDDVEPWAWQGYDDSLMFMEPLDDGYRYYYYRPGEEYPYFVRDPDWGYGYDDGALAMIYDAVGGILPYDRYDDGPWLDYASSYYDRGHRLYSASRHRHPVLAANWYEVQPVYSLAFVDWGQDLWSQPDWLAYHQRTYDPRELYWREERARREAEAIRYASWAEMGFQAAPPPRAIPRDWQRAAWAQDERWFAPPVRGFEGDAEDRQRAAARERERVAALAGATAEQDRVRLTALRERVASRAEARPQRRERIAQLQRRIEDRQAQLASRGDRTAGRQLAQLERQQRILARAEQRQARRARMEPGSARMDRIAGPEPGRVRDWADRRESRGLLEDRAEARQQRASDRRPDSDARSAQRRQVRDLARQERVSRENARRQQQQARAEANVRSLQREEARRASEQQRATREQARQERAQAEARGRAESSARAARREEARQASEQARQQRAQSEAQARARAEERQQARAAAEQQRAAREQARQQRSQAEAQARAEAGARAAQREQARQAADQQRAEARQQQAVRSTERQDQKDNGGGERRGRGKD